MWIQTSVQKPKKITQKTYKPCKRSANILHNHGCEGSQEEMHQQYNKQQVERKANVIIKNLAIRPSTSLANDVQHDHHDDTVTCCYVHVTAAVSSFYFFKKITFYTETSFLKKKI
jgi:hypothetical protein